MTAELWQRLKPLYNAAMDLPSDARETYVARMCGDDPELAAELRALLFAHESASENFSSPLQAASLFLEERPDVLEPDTLLAGRFRIVRHLGSGGMGDVYEALDEQLEQGRIALKTIRPAIAKNPVALARFKDEVRTARKVSGTNVCRIHELYLPVARNGRGSTAFLTMELLEGVTLHDRIQQGSPLPVAAMRGIADQLCTALCCIHQSGVTHQDLKPRNVMLVPHNSGERVVVTDFGLARTAATLSHGPQTSGDEPGPVTGTPGYMAPEQFEGREVGPATDIYALGLILYEMATGVQPYAAHTPLAAAIRRSKAPTHASSLRRDLPVAWDDVISRCLCYEPEKRYQSAEEVSAALRHPGKIVFRLGRDHRVAVPTAALLITGVLACFLLTFALWFAFGRPRHRELAPDAAHWYALGMTALREGSYLKATRLLAMVVQRDPSYALAHAALADAWTELDFTQNAQQEMLLASAPDEQRGLKEVELRYIDAVRTTLVRDYSAAAQDYEAILNRLPNDSKAQGYVDLGRIYEKAGKVGQTVAAYEKAAKLNPDDPAPFLHLGILKSRLRDRESAEKAFATAQRLYQAESDLEGLAEVTYQRGYAANAAADSAAATQYLQQSFSTARQIPSLQLEVRSLSQLSSVAYNDGKDDQAIIYANEVINTARANGLEYWVTDGLMRLGNAYLDKGSYAEAEAPLQEALRRAQGGAHPRLEAFTSLTLASLRDQQARPDEQIALAQSALRYFQDYGFLDPIDQSLTLVVRGLRDQGNYEQAFTAGTQLLKDAERSHSAQSALLAEELVGGILFNLERYPEALSHYSKADGVARSLKQDPAYQQVRCAQLLWRLGRPTEAEAELAGISDSYRKRLDIGSEIASTEAEMLLARGDARGALKVAHAAWAQFPALRSTPQPAGYSLLRTAALAEAQLGDLREARELSRNLDRLVYTKAQPLQRARAALVQSRVALASGDTAATRDRASGAEDFFAQKGLLESDALSLLTLAEAAELAGDRQNAEVWSKKSVDKFRQIAQSWGVPLFQQYSARPDRQLTFRTLARLRSASGDSLNDLPH